MNIGQQQPHHHSHGLGTAASGPAASSGSDAADTSLLTQYILEPPEWRAPLLAAKTPALYPDFFPGATALYPQPTSQSAGHVPGISRDSSAAASGSQVLPIAGVTASKEDELNETVAKLGFVNRAVVQTENFSAHALIHNKLLNGPSIHALGKIIQRVLERQNTDEGLLPNPGPWTYKAPSKVVYNPNRLESWYTDLANPTVPLSKLAKNIPSAPSSSAQSITSTGTGTYTGSTSMTTPVPNATKFSGSAMDRNVDMLINRQVPLYRALWFLQAVGQSDIVQLSKSKNLQVHPILSYSGDYTVSLVESLKRQIAEAVLPLTQTAGSGRLLPGMSVKGRPRNVLAEDQSRDRWMAKWNYTLSLLSASLDDGMLDRQKLCSLLLQNLQELHPQARVQTLWWFSVILQTTIDDMLATAWMSKALVVILYEWLKSLNEKPSQNDPTSITCEEVGQSLLRHIWLTDSDMFLIPQLWSTEKDTEELRAILGIRTSSEASDSDTSLWTDLEERAHILLCRKPPRDDPCRTLQLAASTACGTSHYSLDSHHWNINAVEAIRLLDRWESSDSIDGLARRLLEATAGIATSPCIKEPRTVEENGGGNTDLHPELVQLLLMWATITMRRGCHRAYLVGSILCLYADIPRRSNRYLQQSSDAAPGNSSGTQTDRFEALQDYIMHWIDCQEKHFSASAGIRPQIEWTSRENILSMCQLLLNQGILEISGLVQKVIARGHSDAGDPKNHGIYAQILQDYGEQSERQALRWQMERASVTARPAAGSVMLENIQSDILKKVRPLLERLKRQEHYDGDETWYIDPGDIEADLRPLSTMKRAWIVNEWLVPHFQQAIQATPHGHLPAPVILSLLELFRSLEAFEPLAYFLNLVLREFTLDLKTVESLVSMHQVHELLFAAMDDLPTYARSLFTACERLSDKEHPGSFVLSEFASLGQSRLLSKSQLRALRRNLSKWRHQSSLPTLLSSILSPSDNNDENRDSLADGMRCIQDFCWSYRQKPQDSSVVDKTLADLLSVFGAPFDFVGSILPAMMQLSPDILQEQSNISALVVLCSAIVNAQVLSDVDSCRAESDQPLKALGTFTPPHAMFVQQLITANILGIEHVLANVCSPLLRRYAVHHTLDSSVSVLLELITSLLVDSGGTNTQSWRIQAARMNLYRRPTFRSLYHICSQLSSVLDREPSSTWRHQARKVYEGILAQSEFQSAFIQYLEEQDLQDTYATDTSEGDLPFVWDALSAIVDPCVGTQRSPPSHPEETQSKYALAVLLLSGGTFAPYVTHIARWYFRTLLLRYRHTAVLPADNELSSARPFAEQCLQYLLDTPQSDSQAQLGMFSEYLGNDVSNFRLSPAHPANLGQCPKLLVIMFEALAKKLELYCRGVSAFSDPQTIRASLAILGHIAQLTSLAGEIYSSLPRISTHLIAESLLGDILQKASELLHAMYANPPPQSVLGLSAAEQVILVARIASLALNCGGGEPGLGSSTNEAMRNFATSLCDWHQRLQAGGIEHQYLQDVVGWVLQSIPGQCRNHSMVQYQSLVFADNVARDEWPRSNCKQVSPGLRPLLSCIRIGDVRYMTLRKTWVGMNVQGDTPNTDAKINNEPVDLLSYSCRTRNLDSHLQSAFRTREQGPWESFDSEFPWHSGTTFQRDFRRSTIAQPDFASAGQAQALRNRASSHTDARTPLPKGNMPVQGGNPKHPIKDKNVDGQARDVAPKKRKAIPDVVVIEENSPKKKVKVASNAANRTVAAKQPKNK